MMFRGSHNKNNKKTAPAAADGKKEQHHSSSAASSSSGPELMLLNPFLDKNKNKKNYRRVLNLPFCGWCRRRQVLIVIVFLLVVVMVKITITIRRSYQSAMLGLQQLNLAYSSMIPPPSSLSSSLSEESSNNITSIIVERRQRRRAYCTMYTDSNPCYDMALLVFLTTWMEMNSKYPMLLLHSKPLPIQVIEFLQKEEEENQNQDHEDQEEHPHPQEQQNNEEEQQPQNSKNRRKRKKRIYTIPVKERYSSIVFNSRWRTMATKFYIFSQIDYADQILYYDSDHIFITNTTNNTNTTTTSSSLDDIMFFENTNQITTTTTMMMMKNGQKEQEQEQSLLQPRSEVFYAYPEQGQAERGGGQAGRRGGRGRGQRGDSFNAGQLLIRTSPMIQDALQLIYNNRYWVLPSLLDIFLSGDQRFLNGIFASSSAAAATTTRSSGDTTTSTTIAPTHLKWHPLPDPRQEEEEEEQQHKNNKNNNNIIQLPIHDKIWKLATLPTYAKEKEHRELARHIIDSLQLRNQLYQCMNLSIANLRSHGGRKSIEYWF